jgi:hypothetical protein
MRQCGECVACCVSPEIAELGKPWKVACPKLATEEVAPSQLSGCNNCTIYTTRPEPCVKYSCAWMEGYGEDGDRPDLCGMLIDRREDVKGAPTAKALWRNASSEPAAQSALRRMSEDIGKPLLVARIQDFAIIEVVGSGHGGG